MKKLILVAGARPNFMKVAPILRIARDRYGASIEATWVHTGQHYDYEMSQSFCDDLELGTPAHHLEVGSGSHAYQTAHIMIEFEKVLMEENPDAVVVVGDVNSTIACALTAKKLGIKVAHVEAGLRSRDLSMPEEINRILTDSISDWLFVSERSGIENLLTEGKSAASIHFVGNVMIDTLHHQLDRMQEDAQSLKLPEGGYSVLTLHRPSNVDSNDKLMEIMKAIAIIAIDMPVYFPIHPRTRQRLESLGPLQRWVDSNIHLMPPLPYRAFLGLWKKASLVLTDSGGLQEETTALGVPCLTLRDNTERPITVEVGTNTIVGTKGEGIGEAYEDFKNSGSRKGKVPELWDGKAAERIVSVLVETAVPGLQR